MKYASFERLVLLVGGLSILATLALSPTTLVFQEVVAQLLVFVVLFGAVHWGRRGGFFAAIIATIIYIALWIPELQPAGGVTSQTLLLMVLRVLVYGLIGIVGGELCMRMKYVLTSLQEATGVDEVSGIFSEQMLAQLMDGAIARFERYQEPFCLVVMEPPQAGVRTPSTNRERALVKQIASHIRSDIRLMDEAGRTADGRFFVLLPHTPKGGGAIVTERLAKGMDKLVQATDHGSHVMGHCYGAAEDTIAIGELRGGLSIPAADQALSPA